MDCTPAIPPQAAMKSPLFIEGGAGEWSEATMCTCPLRVLPELVPIACGAERRRTFGDRAQPLDVLVGEEQIVRTRFNGNIDTLCLGFGRQSDSAPTADVNDVEAGAGFFASRSARWMASSSATTGRDSRKARTVRDVKRAPRPRVNSSLSAWTATGSSRRAASRRPSSKVISSARGNSGRLELHMNALKPTTPRAAISAMSETEPGTSPPHSPKSVMDEAECGTLAIECRVHGAGRGIERHVEEQRAAAGRRALDCQSHLPTPSARVR